MPWVILIILIVLAGWLFWCILRINKQTEIERRKFMAGEMLQLAWYVPYLAGSTDPRIKEVKLKKYGIRVTLENGKTDRRESAQGEYFADYSKAVQDWKKFYAKKIKETEKFLAAAKAEWARHNEKLTRPKGRVERRVMARQGGHE